MEFQSVFHLVGRIWFGYVRKYANEADLKIWSVHMTLVVTKMMMESLLLNHGSMPVNHPWSGVSALLEQRSVFRRCCSSFVSVREIQSFLRRDQEMSLL